MEKLSYRIKQVKACSIEEAERIVTSLGLDLNGHGDTKCSCPVHHGDNPTGFSYYGRERIWSCFTHHCQKTYGNDLIGLIRGIRQCTFHEAINYAETFLLNYNRDEEELDHHIFLSKNQSIETSNFAFDLSKKARYHKPLLEKGFLPDTIKAFHPIYGGEVSDTLKGRYALPIIDHKKKVIGFTARRLNDNMTIKWMHFPKGLEKENILFGLNLAQEYISKTQTAFIVEGPHDVMRMYENGYRNTVGIFGTSISINQIKLLMQFGAKQIFIALDPDEAGIESSNQIYNKLLPYFTIKNLTPLLTKEPGDMTKIEMDTLWQTIPK